MPRQDWREPYVGEGIDGVYRSARIDHEEADTLPLGSDRWWALIDSEGRWLLQAKEMEASDDAEG